MESCSDSDHLARNALPDSSVWGNFVDGYNQSQSPLVSLSCFIQSLNIICAPVMGQIFSNACIPRDRVIAPALRKTQTPPEDMEISLLWEEFLSAFYGRHYQKVTTYCSVF